MHCSRLRSGFPQSVDTAPTSRAKGRPAMTRSPALPAGPAGGQTWMIGAGIAAAIALLALLGAAGPGLLGGSVRFCRWFTLMLTPGAAIYGLVARRSPDTLEAVLASLVLSPVALACAVVIALLGGLRAPAIALGAITVSGVTAVAALAAIRRPFTPVRRRDAIVLLALVAAIVALTAGLPLVREWWRVRDDAWFHAAVVAQIDHYGAPPQDPYFVGMPLQYMWFYHALVLVLGTSLKVSTFWVMALINVQALAALGVAGYHLASVFRERIEHRILASITLLLGFNAAFWMFLPVKLARSLIGDVRGIEEIKRTFSLTPFDYTTACHFMQIYHNQEFFLDKFMVATAFGLALTFMTLAWSSASTYLGSRRPASLVLLAGALIGMLGFHSLVGFVMLVGLVGGAILAYLADRRDTARFKPLVILVSVSVICFLVMTPYLYEVMHAKEREQVFPLSVSLTKTLSIFISVAFVAFLAARNRAFWKDRSLPVRFFLFATLAITAFCLSITLPGPNTYDKLGYFVFIPLSIPAGFRIADSVRLAHRAGPRRNARRVGASVFHPRERAGHCVVFRDPRSGRRHVGRGASVGLGARAHGSRRCLSGQ